MMDGVAGQMHRVRNWAITLGVADAIVIALTVHAHLTFHRTAAGPSVMTAGQALGWSFSVLLFVALVILLGLARMDVKYRRRNYQPPQDRGPRLRR
jgi:hypothetical protein